jgi:hypothetical protein
MSRKRKRRPGGRGEWVDRTDPRIAEAAEAAGVATDAVMAVGPNDAGAVALYTTDDVPSRSSPVTRATLERDGDGVLRVVSREAAGVVGDFLPPRDP